MSLRFRFGVIHIEREKWMVAEAIVRIFGHGRYLVQWSFPRRRILQFLSEREIAADFNGSGLRGLWRLTRS